MARRNPNIPVATSTACSKSKILRSLKGLDADQDAHRRIFEMEREFRRKIQAHIAALPVASAKFKNFSTSPFVLMFYAQAKNYTRISEIVGDILPAKLFSSMETSAGRMMEEVALPVYGWEIVPSGMHTANSAIDGKRVENGVVKIVTLKSGPRCLNDEMSENFADNIFAHGTAWLEDSGANSLDFTYGVLYGTKKQSNKKDWHILGKLAGKLGPDNVIATPNGQWSMKFKIGGVGSEATVRVGMEWWEYLGGPTCLLEVSCALIRACVHAGVPDPAGMNYDISDLREIVSAPRDFDDVNFAILQSSQIPWLLFLMRHFCDDLVE
ncbi:PmeII family type II restriction endonuclease [Stenotrophomonas lactitubi]|uniref:PmeII family type II restriction endonuclease n=1 Tax=Stenotrophomonas lactitubi TaxID=2045214 RepID=UPI00320A107F